MNLRWKGLAGVGALGLVSAAGVLTAGMVGLSSMTPAPAAETMTEATTFKIDGVHSSVVYKIKHAGVSHFWGRFNKVEGSFTWDGSKPEAATFDISIPADSIDSANSGRDNHLKNPDFFNTKEFPTITFKSKGLEKSGDGWTLKGELTLLGQTKPVSAKFNFLGERDAGPRMGYRAGFDAEFTIKRSDFGMKYGIENGALGDDVTIIVGIAGTK